ncbi:RNA polymerase sigma factor [Streptomyces aidingensis]|uniref:DNA-directed RNA polymerase specialized sigma subunit, sigma24 family n=1 Tax=Streptomyces aidingensis TaxID=910347 RepID=A0A1I1EIY3_9ACTN|nr:sigma factor-like helix-turn-helix DNA-binding protein [Streptomyces aidingensis]SFB84960.1 DNA-directed RNA polymerase specialized sigma subunit, sigma24 family [Streptomyces aidingensis]
MTTARQKRGAADRVGDAAGAKARTRPAGRADAGRRPRQKQQREEKKEGQREQREQREQRQEREGQARAGRAGEGETPGAAPGAAAAEAEVDLAPLYAFEELYEGQAEPLARQAFLLCGDHKRAEQAVAHAFRLAWERWPEVAVDPDPPGWVRAAAYEYALSPWHRLRPGPRRPRALLPEPGDRTLLNAVLELPPSYRRALVLHEGLGMSVADTAAEVESTTQAAAGRIAHARRHLAARVPELTGAQPREQSRLLARSLDRIAGAQPLRPPPPRLARLRSERTTGRLLYACAALFALLSAALLTAALTGP